MFHVYLTLAYIIPNIYLFFRIRSLFIGKGYRLWYLLIYLLLATIYPLFGQDDYREANLLVQGLTTIAAYILPFCLYLFLAVVLFDLFLLINLKAKILSSQRRKSFLFRVSALSTIVIMASAVVVGGAINLNTIQVSKYEIEVPRRNSIIDHLRIVFVADFHIQQNTSMRFVEQFVRKANALKPDLMLYGGDIVESNRRNGTTTSFELALKGISAKYGTFGVIGNHEIYGGTGLAGFFKNAGIVLLLDSVVMIDSFFYLAGRMDERIGDRETIHSLLKNTTHDLPIILMDHRPTQLQEVSQTTADVQLSGHTHNGQLFPLNFIIHNMYELSWGYRKIRDVHFFVTSGLRLWGPPVKTAGKSEIMLVDIRFK